MLNSLEHHIPNLGSNWDIRFPDKQTLINTAAKGIDWGQDTLKSFLPKVKNSLDRLIDELNTNKEDCKYTYDVQYVSNNDTTSGVFKLVVTFFRKEGQDLKVQGLRVELENIRLPTDGQTITNNVADKVLIEIITKHKFLINNQ